jgi:putative SOS response-associated peptidase YedK/uncharacterized membrane protein
MCGRYYIEEDDMSERLQYLVETAGKKAEARGLEVKTGEIFPTDIVPVIANGRDLRPAVFPMRWGFPSARGDSTFINARSETADTKPLFRDSAKYRRCLLPATNYFEWAHNTGVKTKYSIKTPGQGIMYLAGLYTRSADFPYGEFTVLTRQAPESIAFIDAEAFKGMTDLTSVVIPADVTAVGTSAFENCGKLSSVTFAGGSTCASIGANSFAGDTALTAIIIPASVTAVGTSAFAGDTKLAGVTFASGSACASIGASAFKDDSVLTSINIPKSVTAIGAGAFAGNTKLAAVVFEAESRCATIGESAFSGDTDLTAITIPAGVAALGSKTFAGNTKLAGVTFLGSCPTMTNDDAFTGVAAVVTVPASWNNTANRTQHGGTLTYTGPCGSNAAYSFDVAAGTLKITGTGELYDNAFKDMTSIKSVSIPEGVTSVGERTFAGCSELAEISIPASVTAIGAGAFAGNTKLARVTFADNSGLISIGASTFAGNTALASITVPESVSAIGSKAFSSDTALKNVIFSGPCPAMTNDDAFTGVTAAVTVPSSWNKATDRTQHGGTLHYTGPCGANAVYSYDVGTGAMTITGTGDLYNNLFKDLAGLKSAAIAEGVTSIGAGTFSGCTGLTEITIPASVTAIGESAFGGNTNLAEVSFASGSQCATIGASAFAGNTALTAITIPKEVTEIGNAAFSGDTALKTVTFDKDGALDAIGASSFAGCSALEELEMPKGVASIGSKAFDNDTLLKKITFVNDCPEDVAADAFSGITANVYVTGSWTPKQMQQYGAVKLTYILPSSGEVTVRVPASSETGTTSVSATVKNGVATVSATDEQISDIASKTEETGTVTIDLSDIKADSAVIPAEIISAVQNSKGVDGIDVVMPSGSISLDKTALDSVKEQNVKIEIKPVEKTGLNEEQKDTLGSQLENATVVSVNVYVNNVLTHEFNGGKVTVTVPYTLKPGDKAESITVWYLADDGSITPMNGTYDEKTKTVTFTTDHLSEYVVVSFPFTDVAKTSWYYGDVAYVYLHGLFAGTSDTAFSPDMTMTRGMLVAVLWNSDGKPEAKTAASFKDVGTSDYYAKAVSWAYENGIVSGSSKTTFSPGEPITREQMAAILYRYAQYENIDMSVGDKSGIQNYTDVGSISKYAVAAVSWAHGAGLMQGSDNKLMPRSGATRSQVAAILTGFYQKLK